MGSEGFKETEIGLIPEDWELGVFKNDLSVKGRIGWRGYKRSDLVEAGPMVLGGSNINNNFYIDQSESKFLSREKYEESPEIMLKKGDILLVTRGNLGELGYFDGSIKEATINPSLVILSEFKGNSKFLFYYLISNLGQLNILSISSGSSVPAIYQADVKKIKYPKPPFAEQNKISDILFKIDQKIEINNQMNQTLESIGQAIFRHWFVHFEFPDENGHPYKSSGGEMEDSEMGEIPKGWEVGKFNDIANLMMGLSPKSDSYNQDNIGVPLLNGAADLKENIIAPTKYTTSPTRICNKGDLLFCIRATIGNVNFADSEYCLGRGVAAISPKELYYKEFIYFNLLRSLETLVSQAAGSVIKGLSKPDIENLEIIIPENNIMKKFNSIIHSLFTKKDVNKDENEHLSQIRDSLLPKLMSGKIRVPMEASND